MQSIRPLLDAVGIDGRGGGRGRRVLDVATGPGYGAGEAHARGAVASGLDISPKMIALARTNFPGVPFIEGDGQTLPFDAEEFDVVICNFGLPQMDDPARTIAEAHRVLVPGGRYGVALRGLTGKDYHKQMVISAVREHGDADVSFYSKTDMGLRDPADYQPLLAEAGFADIAMREIQIVWQPKTEKEIIDTIYSGSRSSRMVRPHSPAAQEKINRAMLNFAARFKGPDGYNILRLAAMLTATKA